MITVNDNERINDDNDRILSERERERDVMMITITAIPGTDNKLCLVIINTVGYDW